MAEGTVTPSTSDTTGNYFTLVELRAYKTELASTATYPDAAVANARAWAEERFEKTFAAAFVPRTASLTTVGRGLTDITLPHHDITTVSSATVGGVALTADQLAALVVYPFGRVRNPDGWTAEKQVVINYGYGRTSVPVPVKLAVMLLASEYLANNNLASRATTESTDVGFIRLSYAQPGKTGIPEVDAIGAEYGHGGAFIG